MNRRHLVALAGLALAAAACGRRVTAAPVPEASATARPIEMFSWWERVGGTDPVAALITEHRRQHPSEVVINASVGLSGHARKTLSARLLRDEPPDTFQANVGRDLMQWVLVNGVDERESKLLPLDDLVAGAAAWRAVIPAAVVDQVTLHGKVYGVPANVHRVNSVFYNRKVFREHGLQEPKSIDDVHAIGRKLHDTEISVLALGSREPWTLSLLVFECLLVAREGADTYRQYFQRELKADDPRIVATLEASLALFDLANANHGDLSWLEAVDLVVRGRAAMTVMGDWARVAFEASGLKLGVDYGEIAFPGTEGVLVFTSDTFSLPAGAPNPTGARDLLATIGSAQGQAAVNGARGVLAARLDVPPPADDPVRMAKHALLRKGKLALALSGLVPHAFEDELADALAEMISQRDIEPALQTLRSRYPLLK